MEPPNISDALTNTRPPVAEREWKVVPSLVERFRPPGGTLIVQHAGYQSAAIPLWGEIIPLSVQPTNFVVVLLQPVTK
jgi:hypothetical protein